MSETRKDERADKPEIGGAHGSRDGGPAVRPPNNAQIGGSGPGSLGDLTRDADQETPGTGQSGPGEGQGRSPMSDKTGG